jgi:uncharacterized protein (TIGR01777 family)
MKVVLIGGSGQVGQILARYFHQRGDDVCVIARSTPNSASWRTAKWDGKTLGAWTTELESADAVVHLSGRTVNCRYTPEHRREILESRTLTTTLVGEAISQCSQPPRAWLNASTATWYRHALDHSQDELTGEPGGHEPNVPETWTFSVNIGRAWEEAFFTAPTPHTRRVAMRISMVMSPDPGGVFRVLLNLVRVGLGGPQGSGKQYVSWIEDTDFARVVAFLIERDDLSGPINLCAPGALANRDFLRAMRKAWGMPLGLPAFAWMLEIGAVFLRTETELILKSRWVRPTRLLDAGFIFEHPQWTEAARDLVGRVRSKQ